MDKFYLQINGTAMGTPTAPSYANIFLADIENKMLAEYYENYKIKPLIWLRYLDDIFTIWTNGEEQLNHFLNFLQTYSHEKQLQTKLAFDIFTSKESVSFLDVQITALNGTLITDIFSKKTDSHFYLRKESCHPVHCKKGLIQSQMLRLRRICSNPTTFHKRTLEYKIYFLKRGYTNDDIEKAIGYATLQDRQSLLQYKKPNDSERIPCVITFHPKVRKLSHILTQHFHLLENDTRSRMIFNSPPMVAFRKLKNIKDYVIRTDLIKPTRDITGLNEKCKRPRCQTCPIFQESNTITNEINGKTIKVLNPGNCASSNCVYAITCKKCREMYVGETGTKLSVRMNGHRSDINLNNKMVETAQHFNKKDHSVKDMQVTILEHNPQWSNYDRKQKEDLYIGILHTLQPQGMNRKHGEIVKYFYTGF